MEVPNLFDKLGGRKFILGVLSLASLILLSLKAPTAVTPELIAGLLGIITAFNISNVTTTLKGMGQNVSAPMDLPPPNPTDPNLSDQLKVELLNFQQQIDQANQRVETMADIVQKSLLTRPATSDSLNTVPLRYGTSEGITDAATPTAQADTNRAAIQEYLSQTFGQRRG